MLVAAVKVRTSLQRLRIQGLVCSPRPQCLAPSGLGPRVFM